MRLNLRNKKQEGESQKLLSAQELKWRMDVAKGGRRGRGHRSGTNDLRPGIFTSANLLPVPPTTPSSRQSAHTSVGVQDDPLGRTSFVFHYSHLLKILFCFIMYIPLAQ